MAWQFEFTKIAICIPYLSKVDLAWAVAFKKLIIPPNSFLVLRRGLTIDLAREYSVLQALREERGKPTHIFFLDSDVIPPADALFKLLSLHYPFVSAVYFAKKKNQKQPAVWKRFRYDVPEGLTHKDEILKEIKNFVKRNAKKLIFVDGSIRQAVTSERIQF